MRNRVGLILFLCGFGLIASITGCSDGDNNGGLAQLPVSASAAATILGGANGAIPNVIDFSDGLADLLELVGPSPLTTDTRGTACRNIPGFVLENLCTVPTSGQVCDVSGTEVDWIFANCSAPELGATLNGTVRVTSLAPNVFSLNFDLVIDGSERIDSLVTFTLGGNCPVADYSGLTLVQDGASAAYDNGSLEVCSDTDSSGFFDVTVNAPGFETFAATVNVNGGSADATVRDTGGPLYSCSFDLQAETGDCIDYVESN